MAKTRLSKVVLTIKGVWSPTVEYEKLDLVNHLGSSYIAKRDNIGVTPVEGDDWSLSAEKGGRGDQGDKIYLHIAYANSEDGETDFTTSPVVDRIYTYLGQYSDYTPEDSTVPSKYRWFKLSEEAARAAAELLRVAAENERVTAETARTSAESLRDSAESARNTAEETRVSNESARKTAETSRVSAENTRDTSETDRVNAEISRATAETARVNAEGERVTAEQGRVSAESGRVSAEQGRVSAETERVTAETERAATFSGYQNEIAQFKTEIVTSKDVATENTRFAIGTAEQTLEVPSMEEFNAVKDDIADVNSLFISETYTSRNLLDVSELETGCYYWVDGKHINESYNSTPLIQVTEGMKLYLQTGTQIKVGRSNKSIRFVVPYDENETIITSNCVQDQNPYTVPSGVAYVRFSAIASNFAAAEYPVVLSSSDGAVEDYIEYFAPYSTKTLNDSANSQQTLQNTQDIANLKEQIVTEVTANCIFAVKADALSADQNLICCNSCDNKKNEYIELSAKFSTFGELTIAHGKGSYMGSYITITASKLQIYAYNGTLLEDFEHGLTITDFINVIIYTKNDDSCRSRITIMSAGGDYTASNTRYYSCRAAVLCNATFAMTDVQMKYTVNDGKEKVWVFGDSYISMGDPNRWATQAVQNGHVKMMLHGYSGAMSADEIVPFRALLNVAKPDYLVWALGMNDGDTSSAVNANWKTCVDEVIATCKAKGIIPILATIPNVPNIINTYKNEYVRNSECRYVDFAKAVNGEATGATWYAGMLSSDNTHPTELGAKALMRQFLQDVPEVLYAED